MTVTAPRRPSRARLLKALFEEARRRARRRRLAYATAAAAALACGSAAFVVLDGGRSDDGSDRAPDRPVVAPGLALARTPYLGVSCPRANDIGCDRVGLAVWLRRPAARLTATVAGRRIAMRLPCGAGRQLEPCARYCRDRAIRQDQPCGTYFEGFLRPAGLTRGPLQVRPDRASRWTGARAPSGRVRLLAGYRDGGQAQTELRVPLRPGWG
jgi:hypothetical protein